MDLLTQEHSVQIVMAQERNNMKYDKALGKAKKLGKENAQDYVPYEKSRTKKILKEHEEKIHSKYYK